MPATNESRLQVELKSSDMIIIIITQLPKENKKSKVNPLPFVGIAVLLLAAALKFAEVAEKRDGEWVLKEKRQEEIDKKVEEQENAELYYLLARVSGYYECFLCESGTIWMNEGE